MLALHGEVKLLALAGAEVRIQPFTGTGRGCIDARKVRLWKSLVGGASGATKPSKPLPVGPMRKALAVWNCPYAAQVGSFITGLMH